MDIQKTQRIANHILQRLAKYAEFNKRLTSEVTRVQIYNQESLLNLAKLEIPLDIQSISDKILLINSLLKWFKFSYFKWVNNLPCDYCNSTNTVGIKAGHPTQEDLMYGASRIEQYQCTVCSRVSRFPRYNDPKILMKTRRGRCGEWANVFTLFCRAVGFRARYVLDYTDHVWTEVYIDSKWSN